MTKVGFISLGCPKNLIDTEVMLHKLITAGYEITPVEAETEIMIINTCAFTESAKQESIDTIIDAAWLKKNAALRGIVVTGCLAERYKDEILKELPEADALVGVGSISDIVEAVKAVEGGKKEKFTAFAPAEEGQLGGDRLVTTPEYFAYLKVAEGCDNRCTYCAIPSIRGAFRSRPIEDIIEEAKNLEGLGAKEIVLVAQDTTRYGLDIYGEYKLSELISEILNATEKPMIRILYCYPDKITDELIEVMASSDRVIKYIDMPIQHISDSVLARMNRHGGSEVIKDAVKRLRAGVPGIVIRTTVIVGFPGETEQDFNELCEFVKETRFERLGAFTYSREEGTPAYSLDGQIDEQVKQDRFDIIMSEQLRISESYNESQIGKTLTVLCEGYDVVAESYFGRSYADAPEIDGKVYFTKNSDGKFAEGDIVSVKITEILDYDLIGEAE